MKPLSTFLAVGLAVAAALQVAPAIAQSTPGRDCYFDWGSSCERARAARAAQLYHLVPIERLRNRGVQARRAMFVDGHLYVDRRSQDLGLITFLRRPGRPPTLIFQLPSDEGSGRLVAAVPMDVWRDVLARSSGFDRPRGQAAIGFHCWQYTVEASDPAAAGHAAAARRRYDTYCTEGSPAVAYAEYLARIAATLFPDCDALRAERFELPLLRLNRCAEFSGNRIAAAQADNVMEAIIPRHPSADPDEDAEGGAPAAPDGLDALFAADARLDWARESVRGHDAVVVRWRQGLTRNPPMLVRWIRIHGVDAGRVVSSGYLFYVTYPDSGGPPGGICHVAPLTLVWIRGAGQRFAVVRATVGEFHERR